MGIMPPDPGQHRDRSGQSLVTAFRNRHGDDEVTVRPGADAANVAAAIAGLQDDAVFLDHYGDVALVMVFRPLPAGWVPEVEADHDPRLAVRWIPAGPIDTEPLSLPISRRRDALAYVLAGVPLGDYDRFTVNWLADMDTTTVATIASLIRRARRAEATGRG
jgi:uncharacterized repeat protein (TIGR03917 family)